MDKTADTTKTALLESVTHPTSLNSLLAPQVVMLYASYVCRDMRR